MIASFLFVTVADFADLQMLVEWKVEETEVDDFAFTMSVDKIVLR